MATETAVVASTGSEGSTSQNVLLFELENAAVDGRAKLFEAAKGVFKSAGVSLTDKMFARYCGLGSYTAIIEKLISEYGNDKLADDAADSIASAYVASIESGAKLHPLFAELIKETTRRGMGAHAISILPEESAQAVLKKIGLGNDSVSLHSFAQSERHFPRVDIWMKVWRQNAKSARTCISVAGSRDSGKSALSSGMRCVIIPDQFTSYQDFGGTDAVLENTEDVSIAELIDSLI